MCVCTAMWTAARSFDDALSRFQSLCPGLVGGGAALSRDDRRLTWLWSYSHRVSFDLCAQAFVRSVKFCLLDFFSERRLSFLCILPPDGTPTDNAGPSTPPPPVEAASEDAAALSTATATPSNNGDATGEATRKRKRAVAGVSSALARNGTPEASCAAITSRVASQVASLADADVEWLLDLPSARKVQERDPSAGLKQKRALIVKYLACVVWQHVLCSCWVVGRRLLAWCTACLTVGLGLVISRLHEHRIGYAVVFALVRHVLVTQYGDKASLG